MQHVLFGEQHLLVVQYRRSGQGQHVFHDQLYLFDIFEQHFFYVRYRRPNQRQHVVHVFLEQRRQLSNPQRLHLDPQFYHYGHFQCDAYYLSDLFFNHLSKAQHCHYHGMSSTLNKPCLQLTNNQQSITTSPTTLTRTRTTTTTTTQNITQTATTTTTTTSTPGAIVNLLAYPARFCAVSPVSRNGNVPNLQPITLRLPSDRSGDAPYTGSSDCVRTLDGPASFSWDTISFGEIPGDCTVNFYQGDSCFNEDEGVRSLGLVNGQGGCHNLRGVGSVQVVCEGS
ncbi:uncharacterized protein LTR77_000424 [Saxophila tyrrhenica]|uniref:Uncharacterized protein n=1 Tax=Saxophila tyrrhenica TaxID=1690608 RepID=A0AAV9PMU0_9PEZI|nr:hypothetical protein LTR77_000424 [Saxophila tyrrhenica]